MGLWSFYFFGKLFLYFAKFIGFYFWPNLGFAAARLIPLRSRWLRVLRQVIAVPVGVALLYYDSWLPPFKRVLEQGGELSQFTLPYLLELLGRFLNPWVIAGLAAIFVVYWALGRWLRMSTLAVVGIVAVPLMLVLPNLHLQPPSGGAAVTDSAPLVASRSEPATDADLNTALSSFYRAEVLRQVRFTRTEAPFDIILVQICSMAWDDLVYAKQRDHSLLKHFDLLFDNFNSAASYSGPAATRLLRGTCGHQKHTELYRPASPGCYAFNGLIQAGFQPQFLMNHDGRFGNFVDTVRTGGGMTALPVDNRKAPVQLRSFDDSPVYDDLAILTQWWQQRVSSPEARVALYYNSVTLHDGNRAPDKPNASSREAYPERAKKLLDDIDKFLELIASSGRHAVVVFVPEHGAAMNGDRIQIPGLREIPSPSITHIPVGIKLVGRLDPSAGATVAIHEPSSYLGLFELLSRFIAKSPFDSPGPALSEYVRNLPQTESVAENEDNVVMRVGTRYLMRNLDLTWTEYPAGP